MSSIKPPFNDRSPSNNLDHYVCFGIGTCDAHISAYRGAWNEIRARLFARAASQFENQKEC
jgi:hypothetical protein